MDKCQRCGSTVETCRRLCLSCCDLALGVAESHLEKNRATISHLDRELADRNARLGRVATILEDNGCDCECGHDPDGHDEDCERCFACQIDDCLAGWRKDRVKELKNAVPGASEAPCEVCGDMTIKRVAVGDGFAAVCSEACLRAWPNTKSKLDTIAQLEFALHAEQKKSQEWLGCAVECLMFCGEHGVKVSGPGLLDAFKGLVMDVKRITAERDKAVAEATSVRLELGMVQGKHGKTSIQLLQAWARRDRWKVAAKQLWAENWEAYRPGGKIDQLRKESEQLHADALSLRDERDAANTRLARVRELGLCCDHAMRGMECCEDCPLHGWKKEGGS